MPGGPDCGMQAVCTMLDTPGILYFELVHQVSYCIIYSTPDDSIVIVVIRGRLTIRLTRCSIEPANVRVAKYFNTTN